jgi:hypothetical protein
MYALASLRLARAAGLPVLATLAGVAVWIALAAWAMTSAGFILAGWRGLRRPAIA